MTSKIPRNHNRRIKISCVDLFCGVGGLTHGLLQAGVQVLAGVDFDQNCQFPYEFNNNSRFLHRDVRSIQVDELIEVFKDSEFRLLAGCAPCQPFSTYSLKKTRTETYKDQWSLIKNFGFLVENLKPEFVTMENVPRLLDHEVFKEFLKSLENYHVWFKVINCSDYGVPQTRKRLVLMASRIGSIELDPAEKIEASDLTVRNFISHLDPIEAGSSHPIDPLHTSSSLSPINLQRIKASMPGKTWRDWDQSLLADCHKKNSGQTYPAVYGRMEWDALSPTITTQFFGYGNGRFGHPEQNRAISLREAAILQTFPESYKFLSPGETPYFSRLGRWIGNAVPVKLGKAIGTSFIKHCETLCS